MEELAASARSTTNRVEQQQVASAPAVPLPGRSSSPASAERPSGSPRSKAYKVLGEHRPAWWQGNGSGRRAADDDSVEHAFVATARARTSPRPVRSQAVASGVEERRTLRPLGVDLSRSTTVRTTRYRSCTVRPEQTRGRCCSSSPRSTEPAQAEPTIARRRPRLHKVGDQAYAACSVDARRPVPMREPPGPGDFGD